MEIVLPDSSLMYPGGYNMRAPILKEKILRELAVKEEVSILLKNF
ncbi:hypothetical protein P8X24_04715 [Pyrococcus kukulkanii]